MASAVPDGDYDESHLGEPVGACHVWTPRYVVGLDLWSGIYVFYDRIYFCGVEVERLVHHSIQISDSVGSLDSEPFGKSVSGCKQLREIGFLQLGKPGPRS